jgi:PST family polysaccharide transporter
MRSAKINSFWYLTFHLTRVGIVFAGTMFISRILGPTEYGELAYLISLFFYVSTLDALCHQNIAKGLLTETKDENGVLSASLATSGILAAITITILLILSPFMGPPQIMTATLCILASGAFGKISNPISYLFDFHLMSKHSSFALLAGATISILFRVLVLPLSHSLALQGLGQALQFLANGLILQLLYVRYFPKIRWNINWAYVRTLLARSLPSFISTVLFVSLSFCDIFMIKQFLGARDVGIYSVCTKLCEPWVIISSALCASYFPLIFRTSKKEKQESFLKQANHVSILFALISGLILTTSIAEIVYILLGNDYSQVAAIFRIYYWSVGFLFLANVQHLWEVLTGQFYLSLQRAAFAFILKITLNLILGMKYGLTGFAFSTLISYFFYGSGFNLFQERTRKYLIIQIKSLNPKLLFRLNSNE